MKIVHFLPPLTKGGAEKVAVDLANHAVRQGHEVDIVAAYPVAAELLLHAVDPQIGVRYVTQNPSRFAKYAALARWLVSNREWLLSRDIIHCHLTFAALAGSVITMLRRFSGRDRPIVVETYHAVGMPTPGPKRRLAALLARGRDGLVLMADDDYWRRFRGQHPKLRVRTIPNGIVLPSNLPPAKEVAAYKASVGIPSDAPVVGTVGRLVPGRMPLRMIEIFAEIDRLGRSDVHFFIGGEGALADAARDRAAALGIGDRVHLPGLVERPLPAFGMIDIYISINVGPITGIAGLEAAALPKPVIALQARAGHKMGPQDWIWSNPDPAKVAAEAVRLLGAPECRDHLARRQADRVRTEHSVDAMAAAYEAFYAECLEAI